jgi:SHS2 domain-containing protein
VGDAAEATDLTRPFKIIDHTADIGIEVYGRTLKELFSTAAVALFSLISDPEQVRTTETRTVSVSAPDRESLLIRWLNELIYLWDTEHLLFSRFKIARLTSKYLDAECSGERLDPSRHDVHRDVKAATYHMLQINRDTQGYQARIIFDI